jgi:hypothetical protein
MPARKIAISLSSEALALVDRSAVEEGISRSAWFERAVERARRKQALGRALRQARRSGIKGATKNELAALRRQLARTG